MRWRARGDNPTAIALLSSVPDDEALPWVATSLAAALADDGEIERARSTYEAVLQRNPDHVTALCGLGELWLREVDALETARELFERAVELEPANVRAMALLAESQRRQRYLDEAIAGFDAVLSISPDYSWARGSRGQARVEAGDVGGGLEDLLEALRQSPAAEWMLDAFVEALEEHRPARAESELRRLQRELRDSGCPPAALVPIYIRRARLAAAREHWHDADELYGLARIDLPKDKPLAKEHIDVLRQLHREEDALDVLAQLAPPADDEELRWLRYELLWTLNRLSDVRTELEARVDPDDPTSFEAASLGEIYRFEGRREESRRYFEKALAKDPDDAYSLSSLAALDLEEDQWDACRFLATKVLDATPEHAFAIDVLMNLELTVGDEAAVRRLIDRTADIDDQAVVRTRAIGLYGLGEYVAAFRLLDDRRTERDDDPESLRLRGWVELALGQPRQATTSFRDAAAMDHSPAGIIDSVDTLTRVGAWNDALQEIERARQLDNLYAEASMAHFWLEIGDGDEAVRAAQAGVAAVPSSVAAHVVLSRALRCAGRAAESVEPARRARALSLADPVIISNLGESLFVAGERDEARALFADALARRARRVSLDADDIAAGAWWQLRLGQPELSGEAFLQALSRTDRRASVLMGLLLANLVLGTARQVEVLIGRADEELVTLDPVTRRGVVALFLHDLSTVRAELGSDVDRIAQRLDERLRTDVERLGAEVDEALRVSGADPRLTEG